MNPAIDYIDTSEGNAIFPVFKLDSQIQIHIGSPLTPMVNPKISGELFYSPLGKTYNFLYKIEPNPEKVPFKALHVYSVIVPLASSESITIENIKTSEHRRYVLSTKETGTFSFTTDIPSIASSSSTSPFVAVAFAENEKGLYSDRFVSEALYKE